MELDSTTELEDVILEGHAIILFYRHGCRACNTILPIWEKCMEQMEYVNPKWKYYIMVESKATALMNRLNVQYIPQLIVFPCPNQPSGQNGILIPGPGITLRHAHPLILPVDRTVKNVMDLVRPWLTASCGCMVPPVKGRAIVPTVEHNTGTSNTMPLTHPGVGMIRNTFRMKTVISDSLFNWVRDTVVWAEDPVQYWRNKA